MTTDEFVDLRSSTDEPTRVAPGLALWPGLAIVVTVVAINLAGEALRDRLAPETGL